VAEAANINVICLVKQCQEMSRKLRNARANLRVLHSRSYSSRDKISDMFLLANNSC